MAGGGAPATGTGGGQTVFTPPNQATAAFNFGNILQPFIDSSFTAANNLAGFQGGGFPESYVVPNAFNATQNIVNNPFADYGLQSVRNAEGLITGTEAPGAIAGAGSLQNLGNIATYPADQVVNQTLNNPAYGQAEGLGGTLAGQYTTLGGALSGALPQAGYQAGSPMLGAEQQLLSLGFDPQQALYNQSRGQTLDAANVANAMSGTANTPYGASVLGNTLGNFDINWQNNLLNRAATGAGAAGQAGATGLSDITTGGLSGLQALTTGGQAAQGAYLTPANNQVAATLQGTSALGNLIGAAQGAYGGANNLLTGAAGNVAQYGQMPYQTYQAQQGNNLSALANLTGLTNQQYTLPQQTLQDLESYLGLGQSASTIANQIGATNFNEQLQGLQGIGSGIGTGIGALGGINSLTGGGITGLLGGGGGAAAPIDIATGIPTGVGGLDIAGGGGLADVAATAGGGSSFAPLAFLGS